jgi:hypothetical protein
MKRLYKNCLEQFIMVAKVIPEDYRYRWIVNSLPIENQIVKTAPVSDEFTMEIGPHGETYKKQSELEYKGNQLVFYNQLSNISSIILRTKLYDKSGKLDCK